MEEIWKEIPGYDGVYKISNFGRLISLKSGREKFLKFGIANGYYQFNLRKDGGFKKVFIHRLVAFSFIENPENYPQVNHKDENKHNNNVSNLEWCTAKYNMNYGNRTKNASAKRINGKRSKSVEQYLNGVKIAEFPSLNEVNRSLGFSNGCISSCCTGRTKNAYGYQWKFKETSK